MIINSENINFQFEKFSISIHSNHLWDTFSMCVPLNKVFEFSEQGKVLWHIENMKEEKV